MIKEYLSIDQSLDYLEKLTEYRYSLNDLIELNLVGQLDVYFYKFCMIYKKDTSTTHKIEIDGELDYAEMINDLYIGAGIFSPITTNILKSFNNDGYKFNGVIKVIDLLENNTNMLSHRHAHNFSSGDYFYISKHIEGITAAMLGGEKGWIDFTTKLTENLIKFVPLEDLRFSRTQINDIAINGYRTSLAKIEEQQAKITELEAELEQVKAQLKEQARKPENVTIDEGQGDTLLILGAVMDCIKEVAKPNYTQQSLITAITDKYKNTSSLTQSTLTKKFPKAKTHLKQNVTP